MWGWKIRDYNGKWALCYWFSTTKRGLITDTKPSPEAKAVRVRITQSRQVPP